MTTARRAALRHIPDRLYREILRHLPIACVDVAVVSQGAVLLVRRRDPPARGQWWVAGGRVIKGETLRAAAARKAREETGVACAIGPLVYTAETIFGDGPGGIPVHSINSCFLAYPVAKDFTLALDRHHAGHRWVRSIPRRLHPYVRRCLAHAGLAAARQS